MPSDTSRFAALPSIAAALSAALSISALTHPAQAQCAANWVPAPSNPGGRYHHTMTRLGSRGVTVLFGGVDVFGQFLSDTWQLGSTGWVQSTPSTIPSARYNHAVAPTGDGSIVILFGGDGPFGPLNDTWIGDGANWVNFDRPTHPSQRSQHALAFDRPRGRTVLFGGVGPAGVLADTWEFNLVNSWLPVTPTGATPAARVGHAMVYDAVNQVTVLFGGEKVDGLSNETWTWNGTAWTLVSTAGPSPRAGHAMAYDEDLGVVTLFGGVNANGTPLNDTWRWNGQAWSPAPAVNPPSPRLGAAMAHDPASNRLTVLGGFGANLLSDAFAIDRANSATRVEPTSVDQAAGADVVLSLSPLGILQVQRYRWRRNGQTLPESAPYSGTATSVLRIAAAGETENGSYDCVLTVAGGCQEFAAPATVQIDPCKPRRPGNQALYVNGTTGRAIAGGSEFSTLPSQFTLEAWVRPDSIPSGTTTTILSTTGRQSQSTLSLGGVSLGQVDGRLRLRINGGLASPTRDAWLAAGRWNHVAVSVSGAAASFYVDGRLVEQVTVSAQRSPTVSPLAIGGEPNGGGAWNGAIDEVRIWRSARTAQQIQDNLLLPISDINPDLLGQYRFEDGPGELFLDASTPASSASAIVGAFIISNTDFRSPDDCNANGVSDACEIAANPALDRDNDGKLDACNPTCSADFNRDGFLDPDDLSDYIAVFFGGCP